MARRGPRDGLQFIVLRFEVESSSVDFGQGAGVHGGREKHAARRVRRAVQLRHVIAGRHYLYVTE